MPNLFLIIVEGQENVGIVYEVLNSDLRVREIFPFTTSSKDIMYIKTTLDEQEQTYLTLLLPEIKLIGPVEDENEI
jgi:hypothetical protein